MEYLSSPVGKCTFLSGIVFMRHGNNCVSGIAKSKKIVYNIKDNFIPNGNGE